MHNINKYFLFFLCLSAFFVYTSKSIIHTSFLFPERRNELFSNGSDANLTCTDKMWNETFYVIWKIKLINKTRCEINFDSHGRNSDTCNDGKSLRNTSNSQPYLHIPKFSEDDVGIYTCEFAYRGGATNCEIHVNITGRTSVITLVTHLGTSIDI